MNEIKSSIPIPHVPLLELLNTYARASRLSVKFPKIKSNYTFTEFQLLRRVSITPGSNIMELTNFIGVSKGLVSRIVNDFVDRELVLKKRLEGNKKEYAVYLSPLGETHLAFITEEVQPLFTPLVNLLEGIPPQYLSQINLFFNELTELIKKLVENQ